MLVFMIIPALIAGGASLLGGAMANRGARREAQRDRDFQGQQAARSMDFAREESGTQMRFQERMRNTSWQAGIADMKSAGLNPALAYSQGGASAPMGSRGSGAAGSGSRAEQRDVLSGAVSSALQYKRAQAEINSIRAGIQKTRAETEAVRGRPGRILEPAVSAGTGAMEDFFSPRTMRILNYELGSSARSIRDRTKEVIDRVRRFVTERGIGRNRTPRRR